MGKTAGIIIIGNEILSGKIQDQNSHYLCKELRTLGVNVRNIAVLPDELEVVAPAVREYSGRYDYVFTTGGVGPTHDDVTIEAIARAFGKAVLRHPELEKLIRRFYRSESVEVNLKMAEVPEGAQLITEDGLIFPMLAFRNIYIFPGVPEILRKKFSIMRERFRDAPFYLRRVFLREGEGIIATHLNRLLRAFPDILLGSYPVYYDPEYEVQVTIESKDHDYLERASAQFLDELPAGIVVRVE